MTERFGYISYKKNQVKWKPATGKKKKKMKGIVKNSICVLRTLAPNPDLQRKSLLFLLLSRLNMHAHVDEF